MRTYYELLNLQPKATTGEVHATFRRLVARYRTTITVEQLLTDTHFHDYLNAYLTLHGSDRAQYTAALSVTTHSDASSATPPAPPRPRPFDSLNAGERTLLIARIAYWRREMMEAIHQLRLHLEKEPEYAPAWALLGEVYLTVGRLGEGIKSYQRAVEADPANADYATRLQHAKDANDGLVELEIELSPEEELLREERQQRRRGMAYILALGAVIFALAFFIPLRPSSLTFLTLPWTHISILCLSVMVVMAGLGYGRQVAPFEREMVWSSLSAGDRGFRRSYPVGLIYTVLSLISLWLAIVGLLIMSSLDEEWPISTTVLFGLCALTTIALTVLLSALNLPWGTAIVFGGNVLTLAGMLGWWIGSFGAPAFND